MADLKEVVDKQVADAEEQASTRALQVCICLEASNKSDAWILQHTLLINCRNPEQTLKAS